MTAKAKIFMLDNLDSFTYNLVDEFQVLGFEPIIYRNTISADYILAQMEWRSGVFVFYSFLLYS